MSKNFVMRAALCVVALLCASVVMESQANARKLFGGRHGGECGCAAEEASCGCPAAEEPSCGCATVVEEPSCAAPEPSCGCPVVEESCGCPAEPSCGCSSGGRKFKLFGRFRKHGGCGCESSCGAPVECGCGAPVEAACGAPAESAPVEGDAAPPAPEASTTHWWVPARA